MAITWVILFAVIINAYCVLASNNTQTLLATSRNEDAINGILWIRYLYLEVGLTYQSKTIQVYGFYGVYFTKGGNFHYNASAERTYPGVLEFGCNGQIDFVDGISQLDFSLVLQANIHNQDIWLTTDWTFKYLYDADKLIVEYTRGKSKVGKYRDQCDGVADGSGTEAKVNKAVASTSEDQSKYVCTEYYLLTNAEVRAVLVGKCADKLSIHRRASAHNCKGLYQCSGICAKPSRFPGVESGVCMT